VHRPKLVVADEPTGNLDSTSTASVMKALQKIAEERFATLLIVTHSREIARAASRQLLMRDGKITGDTFT
jgi:ABC-type lipoprotein export system ATPase subunit